MRRGRNIGKFAVAAVLSLIVFTAVAPSSASGKTKKAKYGTIRILSTPGGLPLSINGNSYGVTTTDYRSIDLDAGLHSVVVTLPNGQTWTREVDLRAGRIKCITLNYRPVVAPAKSPCPYPVRLSAPSQVTEGELVTYTADAVYSGNQTLSYTWTVSPRSARIISGLGSSTLTVDSTGLAGQSVTTTLVVDDGSGDSSCRLITQATTVVPPIQKQTIVGREFDTCCSCASDDLKARLDNLAVELQNDPSTTTYIFAYGGRTSPSGQVNRLITRVRDYLVTQRGVDAARVIVLNGGFRENDCIEMWILPRGAMSPQSSPTVSETDIKPTPQKRARG
jgi:PEGA domain-containing protein